LWFCDSGDGGGKVNFSKAATLSRACSSVRNWRKIYYRRVLAHDNINECQTSTVALSIAVNLEFLLMHSVTRWIYGKHLAYHIELEQSGVLCTPVLFSFPVLRE